MRHFALLCLGLSCALAGAAEDPAALRHRAVIDAPAGDSHYRLRLTADIYAGLERRDLGDLRILNAQGEPVPYAFVPREPVSPTPVLTAVAKLFPLYGNESQEIDGVKIDVVRGAGGTVIRLAEPGKAQKKQRKLLGYLVDIGKYAKPVQALSLDASNPFADQHRLFQNFKQHPFVRDLLKDGKPIQYGAKVINSGGYYSMPKLCTDGAILIGGEYRLTHPPDEGGVSFR